MWQPEDDDFAVTDVDARAAVEQKKRPEERVPLVEAIFLYGVLALVVAERQELDAIRQLVESDRELFRAGTVTREVAGMQKDVRVGERAELLMVSVRVGEHQHAHRAVGQIIA